MQRFQIFIITFLIILVLLLGIRYAVRGYRYVNKVAHGLSDKTEVVEVNRNRSAKPNTFTTHTPDIWETNRSTPYTAQNNSQPAQIAPPQTENCNLVIHGYMPKYWKTGFNQPIEGVIDYTTWCEGCGRAFLKMSLKITDPTNENATIQTIPLEDRPIQVLCDKTKRRHTTTFKGLTSPSQEKTFDVMVCAEPTNNPSNFKMASVGRLDVRQYPSMEGKLLFGEIQYYHKPFFRKNENKPNLRTGPTNPKPSKTETTQTYKNPQTTPEDIQQAELDCKYGMKIYYPDPDRWVTKPNETISSTVTFEIWNKEYGKSTMLILIGFLDENGKAVGDSMPIYCGEPDSCLKHSYRGVKTFKGLRVPSKPGDYDVVAYGAAAEDLADIRTKFRKRMQDYPTIKVGTLAVQ